jgi:peptidoglycan lytic transglycosylase
MMPAVSHAGISGVSVDALRAAAIASRENMLRTIGLTLAAASLAACAQSSVVSRNSAFVPSTRQAAIEHRRETRVAAREPLSVVRRHQHPESGAGTKSNGVASFYSEDSETASGERFDPNELTAAHPSLPFGTKLRVTNTATGKSVTVRVNDRGPYVAGRVVDVSYSAAQALGMVNSGLANVKLDVMR